MSSEHDTTPVAAYALGTLDPEEREAFARHLTTCAECRDELRSLERVTLAMAAGVPARTPRPELRERVLAGVGSSRPGLPPSPRLRRDHGEAHDAKSGQPWQDSPLSSGPGLQPRQDSFSWSDPRAWMPVAALLVLAIGLGAYSLSLQSRLDSLESRLDVTTREAAEARVALMSARSASAGVQRTMAVLAAPDMARIDLAGQSVSPSARARAFWSRGRGLVVAANNLPALRPGRTYQVWLLPASGAPISAGLLAPDDAGVATVAYDTAPDLAVPAGVAVSEEPAGGVAAPTGALYLVGKRSA